jgi:hypothetical protein
VPQIAAVLGAVAASYAALYCAGIGLRLLPFFVVDALPWAMYSSLVSIVLLPLPVSLRYMMCLWACPVHVLCVVAGVVGNHMVFTTI